MKVCIRMWRKESMNQKREYSQIVLNVKDPSKLIDSEVRVTVNGIDSLWKVSKWQKAYGTF